MNIKAFAFLALSILSTESALCVVAAEAIPTGPARSVPTPGKAEQAVASIEQKLFDRVYANDIIDKRLQRLELLLFGSTQVGTQSERLTHVQKVVASRSARGGARANAALADKQIGALEQKLFKKTYPAESAQKRLSRLETKTMGTSNPTIDTADRIQRLARILGAPETSDLSSEPGGMYGRTRVFTPFNSLRSRNGQQPLPNWPPFGSIMPFPNFPDSDSLPFGNFPEGFEIRPQQQPRALQSPPSERTLPPYLDPNSI